MAGTPLDVGELILNFDPLKPDARFITTATAFAAAAAAPKLPKPIPWPAGFAPAADAPGAPQATDPLPHCDALVVTWTAAEARALASLFTPGVQLEGWHKYTHNLGAFLHKVTGPKAPFNVSPMPMYHHVLGLYYPCRIGKARVLCFKSGLHFAYDGPDVPVKDLWKQIIAETKAKLVVTTGTAGGIGADIKLGDVVIGKAVRFDCTTKFKNEPFAQASFDSSKLPADTFAAVTAALLAPNAEPFKELNADPLKLVFPGSASVAAPTVVTTDFFAYDDSNDSNGLQELGNACEMGDAVLGLAVKGMGHAPVWVAIRNASDPQMDGSLPKAERDKRAAKIYERYGLYTTVGSVLATWATIRAVVPAANQPGAAPAPAALAAAAAAPRRPTPSETAGDLLLQLAAGERLEAGPAGEVGPDAKAALADALTKAHVDPAASDIDWRRLAFVDELGGERRLLLAQVAQHGAEAFRGSYLFDGDALIAKREIAAS